jgi:hypothetical protein
MYTSASRRRKSRCIYATLTDNLCSDVYIVGFACPYLSEHSGGFTMCWSQSNYHATLMTIAASLESGVAAKGSLQSDIKKLG